MTEGSKPSPAQMQAMYAKFGAWQEKFKDKLVDLGGRLGAGKLVADTADSTTADGPFVEVKELVGGYMIVSGESLDEAIEVASACPGLVFRAGRSLTLRCCALEIHRVFLRPRALRSEPSRSEILGRHL